MKVLVESSAIIEYLKGNEKVKAEDFLREFPNSL